MNQKLSLPQGLTHGPKIVPTTRIDPWTQNCPYMDPKFSLPQNIFIRISKNISFCYTEMNVFSVQQISSSFFF